MAKPSADSLSIATVSIPKRVEPFDYLNENQKRIWKEVVDTKPPEWFEADSLSILAAYVVAADLHEQVVKKLNATDLDDEEILKLLKIQDQQQRILGNLGVKMRLTQQSRYTPDRAATANKKTASGKKPWDQ